VARDIGKPVDAEIEVCLHCAFWIAGGKGPNFEHDKKEPPTVPGHQLDTKPVHQDNPELQQEKSVYVAPAISKHRQKEYAEHSHGLNQAQPIEVSYTVDRAVQV